MSWTKLAAISCPILSLPASPPLVSTPPSIRFPSTQLSTILLSQSLADLSCSPVAIDALLAIYRTEILALTNSFTGLFQSITSTSTSPDLLEALRQRTLTLYTASLVTLQATLLSQVSASKPQSLNPSSPQSPIAEPAAVVTPTASRRTEMTAERIAVLEAAYLRKTRLTTAEKLSIANATGLEPRQVAIWFANQRQRRGKKVKVTKAPRAIPIAPKKVTTKRTLERRAKPAGIKTKTKSYDYESEMEEEAEEERRRQVEEAQMEVEMTEKRIREGEEAEMEAMRVPASMDAIATTHSSPIERLGSPFMDSPTSTFYRSPSPILTLAGTTLAAHPSMNWSAYNDPQPFQLPQPAFDLSLPAYASSAYASSISSLSPSPMLSSPFLTPKMEPLEMQIELDEPRFTLDNSPLVGITSSAFFRSPSRPVSGPSVARIKEEVVEEVETREWLVMSEDGDAE